MKRVARKWWVGYVPGTGRYVPFYSNLKPTEASHGHRFGYVIGPRTRSQAEAIADSDGMAAHPMYDDQP